jgi:hypothetical protein
MPFGRPLSAALAPAEMKIYKFKDLTDEKEHSHFLQIVLQNSIWCARPDSLNDEEEFKFKLDYEPSPHTAQLLSEVVAKYRTTKLSTVDVSASLFKDERLECITAPIINELVQKCRTAIGITSFSITKTDDYLWQEYGGKGNGVFVEINIPDHLVGQLYHRVHYVPEKIFHVDAFLESDLIPDRAFETYRNILLTKTKKWSQEEEMRFISKRQDVNLILDGHISEVTFGPCVPAHTLEQLAARIARHCSANNIRITKL